jgi:hypothetical protein
VAADTPTSGGARGNSGELARSRAIEIDLAHGLDWDKDGHTANSSRAPGRVLGRRRRIANRQGGRQRSTNSNELCRRNKARGRTQTAWAAASPLHGPPVLLPFDGEAAQCETDGGGSGARVVSSGGAGLADKGTRMDEGGAAVAL